MNFVSKRSVGRSIVEEYAPGEKLSTRIESKESVSLPQIRCVKDMTTLSGLTDSDSTWRCETYVQEFFQDPCIPILCIYHVNGRLTAEFSFPTVPVHELTYFVRQPNEILRSWNFRERILFGSMNDKVEWHILGVVQNVLAPIFFTIETWPDSILYLSLSTSPCFSLPSTLHLPPLAHLSRLYYCISVELSN